MIRLLGKLDSPASTLLQMTDSDRVRFCYDHDAWYLQGTPSIELHAACELSQDGLFIAIDDNGERLDANIAACESIATGSFEYAPIRLDAPLPLQTVTIDKPWGAEIWYTGIEARGVCRCGDIPLPWLLTLAGPMLLGDTDAHAPILLKILDPLPDDVYGDLYFEMHDQKIEVYIVTEVDQRAWPDGKGAIRFGFDPARISAAGSLAEFKREYTTTVTRYRNLRRQIDHQLDELKARDGIDAATVVRPEKLDTWLEQIDSALIAEESRYRNEMNAFTHLEPLVPGDVVRVPPLTPHSLQHGVRVIEFQTPHYERYILSFAQKVLTQDHWDTDSAIEKVNWDARLDRSLQTAARGEGYLVEVAADFDEFEVHRVTFSQAGRYEPDSEDYLLAITIYGDISINGTRLVAEAAVLIPACINGITVSGSQDSCLLIARPK